MAKEQFRYTETAGLLKLLDEAANRSGVSRGQAFEDFRHMSVCALSGQQMEDEYLKTVAKHTEGKPGQRGCDSIAQLFANTIAAMEDTREGMKDLLGDLFEGAITYGERGQFMTPQSITDLVARLMLGGDEEGPEGEVAEAVESPDERKSVCDPCCGSGRMLLSVAEKHRNREFVGQDVDLRCVRMTAINLALRNLYGYVLWGNSLGNEVKLIYRTGMNMTGGFIRYARPNEFFEKFCQQDDAPQPASDGPDKPALQRTPAPIAFEATGPQPPTAGKVQRELF